MWSPGNHSNQCCWLSHQVRANKPSLLKHLLDSCNREFAFDYMITVIHLILHIVGEGTPISPTHHPFGRIVAFLERARCYEQRRRKFALTHLLDDVTGKKGKAVNGLLSKHFVLLICLFVSDSPNCLILLHLTPMFQSGTLKYWCSLTSAMTKKPSNFQNLSPRIPETIQPYIETSLPGPGDAQSHASTPRSVSEETG